MRRSDAGLAFLLQYENIAWYEDGVVKILDRRAYPLEVRFVICRTHEEVARAIADMVTQSAGPYTAIPMGMALAAYECRNRNDEEQLSYLEKAADTLSHARPTTVSRYAQLCRQCLAVARTAMAAGEDVAMAIRDETLRLNNMRYDAVRKIAEHLTTCVPDGGTIMTYCFAETIIGMLLLECRAQKKTVRLFCPETRPYFQGARLTASVCREMGFDVTVVTDAMAAAVMRWEQVSLFTTAADVICCDGHVTNKVGTFETAIAAKYCGVPYYVTGAPDQGHPDVDSVRIEVRNPGEALRAMGVRTTMDGVKGYYPAFDITPPELITGIVTDRGIFTPALLAEYFESPMEHPDLVI